MIENCTLYFPTTELPLAQIFTDGKFLPDGPTFQYPTEQGQIQLKLNFEPADHLNGFAGYVRQLPGGPERKAEALSLIQNTQSMAGVILPQAVETDSEAFQSLLHLVKVAEGFMFVADSILLPTGQFVIGPAADTSADEPRPPINLDELKHEGPTEGIDPERVAMRERHYRLLGEHGFRCARWLPLYRSEDGNDAMRPPREILFRFQALRALFLWVSVGEDLATTPALQGYISRHQLADHLTAEEASILELTRDVANQEHQGSIGWRLENMWALAWVLGFDPAPQFHQGQLPGEVTRALVLEFHEDLSLNLDERVPQLAIRPIQDLVAMEDLFYCTHNAVRSAQTGETHSVPEGFHPVGDGGAIHERRHSLTWALSPGTAWDDTDLST